MKVADNQYLYRLETQTENGSTLDYQEIETIEPLRSVGDIHDEIDLENNKQIKRIEEIVFTGESAEYWYNDDTHTTDTHFVAYTESLDFYCNVDHPYCETNRKEFEFGDVHIDENKNFFCTSVELNGMNRIYISIDKSLLSYTVYSHETLKEYFKENPITVWYVLRYPVEIPRTHAKGYVMTHHNSTTIDVQPQTMGKVIPIVKATIEDSSIEMDSVPTLTISNTEEGNQITDLIFEGVTVVNNAKGDNVKGTKEVSHTRYDFQPFYDGQTTINNTIEGGYVSAKLYGDTMINIAKSYGETPLLTATNENTLCDDLLGTNEEGIVLADGEITEGRIYGDSIIKTDYYNVLYKEGVINEQTGKITNPHIGCHSEKMPIPNRTFIFTTPYPYSKVIYFDSNDTIIKYDWSNSQVKPVTSTPPKNASYLIFGADNKGGSTEEITYVYEDNGEAVEEFLADVIQSVVNPNIISNGIFKYGSLDVINGGVVKDSQEQMCTDFLDVPTRGFCFDTKNSWARLAFYNENKEFISYVQTGNSNYAKLYVSTSSIPSGAKYIRYGFGGTNLKDTTIKYTDDNTDIYSNLKLIQATFPYTLNKLPNGVADYIDVVNGVYVQRVERIVLDGTQTFEYLSQLSNAYYYGYVMTLSSNRFAANAAYGLCDKIQYKRNYNFPWSTDGDYVVAAGNQLFIKLTKDKLNSNNTVSSLTNYLTSNPITVLYELATPIYTPLTDEEKALLPLSAYSNGYIQLSSDELRPSKFEFRAKSSNRMQLDMLEKGHYYLDAPTGNVKLGNVDINVNEMPCIINVSDANSKRLISDGIGHNITVPQSDMVDGGYFDSTNGAFTTHQSMCYSPVYYQILPNTIYGLFGGVNMRIHLYDEGQGFIKAIDSPNSSWTYFTTPSNTKYMRISYNIYYKKDYVLISNPITLSKLPSHRIPTTFTQGMKSSVDFGYWQGIIPSSITNFTPKDNATYGEGIKFNTFGNVIENANNSGLMLYRISGTYAKQTVVVEDEFDISTGKYTKRVGKYVIDGTINPYAELEFNHETNIGKVIFLGSTTGIKHKVRWNYTEGLANTESLKFDISYSLLEPHMFIGSKGNINLYVKAGTFGSFTLENVKKYFSENPMTVYYELETPEITYLDLPKNYVTTYNNTTTLETWHNTNELFVQVKPVPLSYPTTLSPNTQYTVFHNRKNYNGSVKTPMINLGGTEVAATGSRTVVTTPSTLAHNELQFIGGENTVEQVMVVHGDWTKEGKTVDYFEGLQSSVIGDKTLENLVDEPTEIWSNKVTDSSNGGALDYVSMDDIIAVGYGSRAKLPEVQVGTNVRTHGMTLQNLATQHECIAEPNAYTRTAVYDGVLPTGTYIFFYNVVEPNPTTQTGGIERFTPYYTCQDGSTNYEGWETLNQTIGLKYWKFTATSPITAFRFWIANIDANCSANNFMLLQYQQGMENWNIPYFEGMKSVENPVLTTIGKNLFNSTFEKHTLDWETGVESTDINVVRTVSYTRVKPNESYVITKQNISGALFYYDKNKSHIKTEWVNTVETINFTTTSDTHFIKMILNTTETELNIQLEQGTQATSYEPYRENILSTPQGTVLRGVGSYKDMIGWNDGIIRRKCVEFTITGEEGYSIHNIVENTNTIMCNISWKVLGLENKIPANVGTNMPICDKLPTMGGNDDVPHIRQDGNQPYSINLIIWFDKTKFSTYTQQGINDYIKSIGGLTIVAPLANTEYEDVEITGGGNWKEFALTGSNTWWDAAGEGDTTNGFSIWTTIDDFVDANDENPLKYRMVKESELEYIDYFKTSNSTNFITFNLEKQIVINVKGCHSIEQVKAWLDEHPITILFQSTGNGLQNTTPNTDVLIFNHGTLYTTTDTHPSTFSDFSLKTTNRYTVKDFDKLKYTVLTEQPFYLNGIDYPSSSTGMTIIDVTGIADTSIYSDDTMITVVQEDGNYYADGVLTQFKGTKTFTKEFIRTSNGTYDTGMTLLEPLELSSIPHLGVYDTYNTITGTIIKNTHTVTITGYEKIWETPNQYSTYVGHKQSSDSNYSPYTAFMQIQTLLPFAGDTTVQSTVSDFACDNVSNIWGGGAKNRILGINAGRLVVVRIPYDELSEDSINGFIEFVKKNPITFTYKLAEPQIIQSTPTSTYISTRPENGNIIAQDTQIQAEYLNYDNEQSIISPRMLGDGDEIRWEQGSQCYVYENDNEYIPLTDHNELFGANIQAQEYTQYAESVDGTDIELGVALKEKAVYEQTYVKYEDNIVYPETMENIDETNGVEVDYICGATWQNPNDLSDIRHLGELREDGQYDVTIRRSGDDEIRLLEGTTHIGLNYNVLPPSEFELTFFNNGGVEVGKYGDTTHMLEDCVENSKLASGTVYGETLINLIDTSLFYRITAAETSRDVSGWITMLGNGSYPLAIHKYQGNLKPDTLYTLVVDVQSNTCSGQLTLVDRYGGGEQGSAFLEYTYAIQPKTVGRFTTTLTTKSDLSMVESDFRVVLNKQALTGESIVFRYMLFEGDYTSYPYDIPYFEGIGSTVVNGFSSCGKNLVDYTQFNYESNSDFTLIDGGYEINFTKPENRIDITIPMKVVQGKTYTIGATIEGDAFFGGMIGNGYYWASPTVAKYTIIATGNADKTVLSIKNMETLGKAKVTNIFFYEGGDGVYTPSTGNVYYQLPTPITLRKVGDVVDTFDVVSGVETRKLKKVILDKLPSGIGITTNETYPDVVGFQIEKGLLGVQANYWYPSFSKTITNGLLAFDEDIMNGGSPVQNEEGIGQSVNEFKFIILKSKLNSYDVNGVNEYLAKNPIIFVFNLGNKATTTKHTLIPSTTQTTQEPTFILPQPLRSVPNGICDRLYWDENKGHYCIEKRVQETILSGKDDDIFTYEYNSYAQGSNTCRFFMRNKSNDLQSGMYGRNTIKCIGSPIKGIEYINEYNGTVGITSLGENGISSTMRVPSSSLETRDTDGVKKYLKNNPQTFIYPLATSEIIDLPHLDKKVELPTQPDIYPIGYKAVHEKANPEIGLTIPYKQLNMPTQPVNLNFVMDIADYVLTWDDVKEARQYNIILNDEVIATVKEPQYNTGEEMYGYILVEANNEIGDNLSEELYIKTVPNAPAQLTVAHNPLTDHYDFEISFIDTSDIADYYTVMYKVDGGEWVINTIQNSELTTGEKHLWSFSVYEIKESIEVWATATNDVGTNDILPTATYYMTPTPQWTYRINSKDVFLRWIDESPYDTKYKLRYSYKSNGQFQYAYFEGDAAEIGKLYEAVLPLAEDDEVTLALCIISEKENLYCKPVKASKPLDPNIVPPMNFNYHWLARGLIEFYWEDQYDVDVEYEYILESMKANETLWTQVNEVIPSEDVEGTGTIYRVEYQLEDLEQIRMKVRMKWAMNDTEWTETLTTVFIPVEGNPPTYIRRTQTAEGLLVEWEAQAYVDSYHIYVIDNETGEELQHLETLDNSILVDLDYSNSIEIAIYEISRFSGGIESDPTDPMVFTPTMFATDIDQRIYRPCAEEYPIETSTVQKATKQPYVIHDISYTPNVETEHEVGVAISSPFQISYHPMMVDVHQAGSRDEHTINAHIKTLDVRNEDLIRVMTFERTQETYDMNFTVYTPSVASYPINLEVSRVRIVCLGDSLTSGHPFYWD